MNEKKDFYHKHREDIIETIQLRAKEKRVLLSLILVFFVTLAYENSAGLTSWLWSDGFSAPELGSRPAITFKAEMLERFERPLALALQEFPQYWAHFAAINKKIALLKSSAKDDPQLGTELTTFTQLVKEFLQHSSVAGNKKFAVLEREITQLMRVLKITVPAGGPLKEISFNRPVSEKNSSNARNLFAFSQE